MTSLTGVVEKMDFRPQLLGQLGIFEPMPVRTRAVFVERRADTLALIPDSPIGAPPVSLVNSKRDAVPLRTTRLAKEFTIYAEEVQGIRAMGSETELQGVQSEYLRRLSLIREDMELTFEYHRLGALQGKLLDADGVTVINNYWTTFGVTEPTAVDFALGASGTNVRLKCQGVTRTMARAAKGTFTPATQVHALCGDTFFDMLIDHPNVRETYKNWAAAADLRQNVAFQAFTYGGITFHNYRGTDDNSTVAIPTGEAKFFPVGARDVFKVAYAPAEFEAFVNTLGRPLYALNIPDRDRGAYVRGELYSYPLFFCQRPDVLQKAVAVVGT
jgi:hypothetical protein